MRSRVLGKVSCERARLVSGGACSGARVLCRNLVVGRPVFSKQGCVSCASEFAECKVFQHPHIIIIIIILLYIYMPQTWPS